MSKHVRSIKFDRTIQKDREIVDLANRVAPMMDRTPTDAVRFLLRRALQQYLEEHEKDGQTALAV